MVNKIYVGLDELLDTRLGLISLKDPEKAKEYLHPENNFYFLRKNDKDIYEDLGLNEKIWEINWNRRDTEVLHHSTVTHIPNAINTIVIEYQRSTERAIEDMIINLEVNLYPYVLNENELTELKGIIEKLIPFITDVNFVRYNLNKLTPSFIKRNYKYIILYDFNKWISIHEEELRKTTLAASHFFVPRLFNLTPTDEYINEDKYTRELWQLDPFKIMESFLAPKMGITFIAASDFSTALRPPIVKKSTNPDLDSVIAQSGTYTPHNFQHDPLYEAPREEPSSQE